MKPPTQTMTPTKPISGRRRRLWRICLIVLVLAVLLRLALPFLARTATNLGLAQLDNFLAEVGSVSMSLSRGVFVFEDFALKRRDRLAPTFIEARRITVDVRMRELLGWRGVVDMRVEEPAIVLVWSPDPGQRQLGDRLRWAEFFNALPVGIDEFRVERGFVSLQNLGSVDSRIDISAIELAMLGMVPDADIQSTEDEARATIEYSAAVIESYPLAGGGDFVPYLGRFSFDLSLDVKDVPLTAANPWLEKFAALDADTGTIDFAASLGFTDTRLHGDTSIEIIDANLAEDGAEEGGPLKRVWEAIANFGLKLFQDDDDRLGRQFPINAEVMLPNNPDLRQIVLTMVLAYREGFGQSPDDPAHVVPPEGSE